MATPTDRDPLLGNATPATTASANVPDGAAIGNAQGTGDRRLGPLELAPSTRYGILAGVWAATFLSALNMTLVPTMLPSISSDFNRSNQASWLGTSYLLATCTFTPLYGRLCNVIGRRGANQLAVFFAALGTLACGLSSSMEMLIAARFLGGLGGGGVFTTSSIVISDMYSMRSRGLTQGVANVFTGLGMGMGGPVGGIITDHFGWRWAFLIQTPFFLVSFFLTSYHLRYVTPNKGTSAKDILKRIDYRGSIALLASVGSLLFFLSTRYNEGLPWSSATVIVPLTLSAVFFVLFVFVEFHVAPEPVLAPFLLKQKIPVLVGISNFLVATCNFSVTYFFPMWFQVVASTSASTAGLHLLPNCLSMSTGSLFAGWMMHRTGKYKMINLIFGFFPFIALILITMIKEDSGWVQLWLSIIPLGFGNAVVLQTMLIALLSHIPHSAMAVGTGFGQLFRGVGQVGGVAISSALFQSILDGELRNRIQGPDAAEMIEKIRHSSTLISSLPINLQRDARDSYAISLKAVFIFAGCSTFLAYCVRLPIPDKKLEQSSPSIKFDAEANPEETSTSSSAAEIPIDSEDESNRKKPVRRLSTFEQAES